MDPNLANCYLGSPKPITIPTELVFLFHVFVIMDIVGFILSGLMFYLIAFFSRAIAIFNS